jgi:hypothetical protein
VVIRGHDKRIECLLLTLASCVSSISLHSEEGVRGLTPLSERMGKKNQSIACRIEQWRHTHWNLTHAAQLRPANIFLRQDRRAGEVIVTGLQLITLVWAAYTITLGEGKWTRWKTRILLWRLMMGCPACAAGRPAGRNFSCFPYSSARQLDSYGEWGKMYLTFFVCNRPRWGDGAGGEGEVFFSIVYCVDKVQQRESCVILNYKLQLYSRWLVCFSCCDGARSRILFLFTFRPNSHWRIVDISIFRPSTQFPFSYIHPSAGRRTGHIVVYKRSVPAIAMEIKIYL